MHSKHWAVPMLLSLTPILSGCEGNFDPASRVNTLRILAVRADLPYAHPGETVVLDAVAHDPDGRQLTWGWAVCENPSDSSVTGCLDTLKARVASGQPVNLTTGSAMTQFSVIVPSDLLTRPSAVPGRALLGVIAVACPGTLEPGVLPTTSDGDPLPIVCRDGNGERFSPFDFVVGMKRVFVRETDRNENPGIGEILWDGQPWPDTLVPTVDACGKQTNDASECSSGFRHDIRVDATPASFEAGTDENGSSFEEQLVVQYYATDGTFADDVRIAKSPETEWVARRDDSGKDVRFWFVVRDDRGGVTWAERTVTVR